MFFIRRAIVLGCAIIGFAGSAYAADMTGAEIKAFLSDKTAYLETTTASASGMAGQVVIYWSANGTALYKAPDGKMLHGTWEVARVVFQR